MRTTIRRGVVGGVIGGAAGTAALNAVTYADMIIRGRPASDAPAELVGRVAERTGVDAVESSNTEDAAANRRSGLGAVSGYATGLAVGAAYGLARGMGIRPPLALGALMMGAGAMAASDGPLAAMGVANPQGWSASDWTSDVVPHLAFGLVGAAVCHRMGPRSGATR
jgi:hypothetical protein